jgi:hypothetical protein
MKPFRIRVNRLIDFGAIVTLIGVDAEASKPVTVHVDYRPFDVVWAAWRDIGSKQPIEYAADGLTLRLGVAGDDHIEGALIGETQIPKPASPNRFRDALRIVTAPPSRRGPSPSNRLTPTISCPRRPPVPPRLCRRAPPAWRELRDEVQCNRRC